MSKFNDDVINLIQKRIDFLKLEISELTAKQNTNDIIAILDDISEITYLKGELLKLRTMDI